MADTSETQQGFIAWRTAGAASAGRGIDLTGEQQTQDTQGTRVRPARASTPASGMTIIPRWEWRTFGESFGPAEERFAALTPERVEESDETYLLSTRSDASVKIRGGVMDVKHLEAVNDDGLEQWLPVLKGEFPLSRGGRRRGVRRARDRPGAARPRRIHARPAH